MFFKHQVITGLYSSFVSLEHQRVKIAFMNSPSNIWALKDGSLKEKAIIKRKPASYGSDFIMFSCCYFHHGLFYIPHLFFFPSWSCILRSHLFGAHNDFYDNFPEKWRTWLQRELQVRVREDFNSWWGIFLCWTQMICPLPRTAWRGPKNEHTAKSKETQALEQWLICRML